MPTVLPSQPLRFFEDFNCKKEYRKGFLYFGIIELGKEYQKTLYLKNTSKYQTANIHIETGSNEVISEPSFLDGLAPEDVQKIEFSYRPFQTVPLRAGLKVECKIVLEM
jgi:hypothetical protein